MKALAPQRLKAFVCQRQKLSSYLRAPGDQRSRPQIPAQWLLWSQLVGLVLREVSYHPGRSTWIRSNVMKQ